MKILKDIILRKHNDFFIKLKNNSYNPCLFFECISLVDCYFKRLTNEEMKLRALLMEFYLWGILQDSFFGVTAELKTEFNEKVKSNFAIKVLPILNEINDCMMQDEGLLSDFYRKFEVDVTKEIKKVSYPDIKQRWGIGIVKDV